MISNSGGDLFPGVPSAKALLNIGQQCGGVQRSSVAAMRPITTSLASVRTVRDLSSLNLADGTPYDTSGWPDWMKRLSVEKDAELIAHYRDPAWVLDGCRRFLPR